MLVILTHCCLLRLPKSSGSSATLPHFPGLFYIAGDNGGGTVAAVVDCPFRGIAPSLSQTLGVKVVACGNEVVSGVEFESMS